MGGRKGTLQTAALVSLVHLGMGDITGSLTTAQRHSTTHREAKTYRCKVTHLVGQYVQSFAFQVCFVVCVVCIIDFLQLHVPLFSFQGVPAVSSLTSKVGARMAKSFVTTTAGAIVSFI